MRNSYKIKIKGQYSGKGLGLKAKVFYSLNFAVYFRTTVSFYGKTPISLASLGLVSY
jgi:hypothetical protein